MQRSSLAAVLAFALTGTMALAQAPQADPNGPPPPPPPHAWHPHPEREAQRIARELNLTPDQTAKLEPIFANRDQQIKAIRENGQLTQDDAREQMRTIEKSTQQQLATVLTPDQLKQLHEMRRNGPHGGPGQPPPPPPPPPTN